MTDHFVLLTTTGLSRRIIQFFTRLFADDKNVDLKGSPSGIFKITHLSDTQLVKLQNRLPRYKDIKLVAVDRWLEIDRF